ncbi:MAG: pyridoxal-phosphate dependent enzyme [Chromatiales bacterium]|jgi:cysteine synthase A|nr:pyridoxal-phosphate dependent enzyme [Chromatiales bacterium]
MGALHDSILATIGGTPVVRLARTGPPHVQLWAKLEGRNPAGSVKDRLALGIIEDAERRGALRPGQTVIEASSGNTGIALAMVCARKGYPLVVVMAENFSVERRRLMRFLGARVVLTPAAEKGSGMMRKAEELAARHGWVLCRQFENPANAEVHARTTAPEILAAFAEAPLDYFVAGCGTGGTLQGVASVLKRERPGVRIVACEPDTAPMLSSGIAQPRDGHGQPSGSHPSFRPHPMQGWSPDAVALLTEQAFAAGLVDQVVPVNGHEAMRVARELAAREGVLTGITGGATVAGALAIAARAPAGASILCLLPDTGERYQSTPLFADVPTDMTDEELAISRSTPSARFDVASMPASPPAATRAVAADPEATGWLDEAVGDATTPVLMFALEWCEFCWSLRRLFARFGIPYRAIDLDSAAWQPDARGLRLRAALTARTGMPTIPQVFVGGELVGGCTDVIEGLRAGDLPSRLGRHGIDVDLAGAPDPRSFLPSWIQPRN